MPLPIIFLSYALSYLCADGARFGKIKACLWTYRKEKGTTSTKALDFNILSANNKASTRLAMTKLI
jgi:hypothetical protein